MVPFTYGLNQSHHSLNKYFYLLQNKGWVYLNIPKLDDETLKICGLIRIFIRIITELTNLFIFILLWKLICVRKRGRWLL